MKNSRVKEEKLKKITKEEGKFVTLIKFKRSKNIVIQRSLPLTGKQLSTERGEKEPEEMRNREKGKGSKVT